MSAPSNTTWGSVVSNGNHQGKIGIATTKTDYPTFETLTIQVWFWSKYKVIDANNKVNVTITIDKATQILVPGVTTNISHPTNTAWSTSNQTLLCSCTATVPKKSAQYSAIVNANLQNIDVLGTTMYARQDCAVSIPVSYTVSYNANGGTNAPASQTKWLATTLKLSTAKPTWNGRDFLGWGTSSTDTTVDYYAGGTYEKNASITLYAIWEPHTYEVWYDANGGTNAPSGQTKLHDTPLPLQTAIPTREGYNFLGWATNSSATTPKYQSGASYTTNASVTLYAVWERAYEKPSISDFTVWRVDADGNATEEGTYAKIRFSWLTDRTGAGYRVYYKRSDQEEYTECISVVLDGALKLIEDFIFDENDNVTFDNEYTYDIKLNVTDSYGYTSVKTVLHKTFMAFDVTPDGRNMSFGESARDSEDGVLRFAYDTVDIAPDESFLYKGEQFFGQKLLWSGSSLMNETHYITLSKKVSEMKNGLLLVFGRNGDYNLMTHFVPKANVMSLGRTTWNFFLCTQLFDYVGSKTLYISDEKIEGHADNDATAKNGTSGITYHNEAFTLRCVFEV